jgi:hypothetical protein
VPPSRAPSLAWSNPATHGPAERGAHRHIASRQTKHRSWGGNAGHHPAVSGCMALLQLIYGSSAVKGFSEVELARILLGARRTNAALGVTGMLLYHDGAFLQVLEGDERNVKAVFERIGKDPRHRRVMILIERNIEARQFEDWSMGFVDVKGIAGGLPGYAEFSTHRDDPAQAGGLASKLLAQFCEGKLRNWVSSR